MNLREISEQNEIERLSKFSQKSVDSKRAIFEEECQIRTKYQRDRDRIIHSKAFRRLAHKTQVFISPHGDHFRTRLSHTLEVSQIARTISKGLGLNEDLTEAIALGHDLGHTPFGHTGEDALTKIIGKPFEHNIQSVRIVEKLERNGLGLNLTSETIDGIKNHRGKGRPATLEGMVVQISDKIAYVNHDIEDAIRAKLITIDDLPKDIIDVVGTRSSERISYFVTDIIEDSLNKDKVMQTKEAKERLYTLRKYLFSNVYEHISLTTERNKVAHVFNELYWHYVNNYKQMPSEHIDMIDSGEEVEVVVCDYIAGMTDRYAISIYKEIFLPKSWKI